VFLEALEDVWLALDEAGRLEDCIMVSKEAISLYRTLAKDRPADLPRELVGSLWEHSVNLYKNGHDYDGLIADEEAVSLCRPFKGCGSNHFVVRAANSFVIGQYDARRVEQANAVCQGAIAI